MFLKFIENDFKSQNLGLQDCIPVGCIPPARYISQYAAPRGVGSGPTGGGCLVPKGYGIQQHGR